MKTMNARELDTIRKSLEAAVKEKNYEKIILGLAELHLLIDEPRYAYREKAFDIEETVLEDLVNIECEKLEFVDKTITENIRNAIFLEVGEAKKRIKLKPNALEEIKKRFEKLISKKPPDLNKIALVLHDAILIEEPGDNTPKYIVSTLKELGLFNEVDKLLDEIVIRAGEKREREREREEEQELKNLEARLRALEREEAKEEKERLRALRPPSKKERVEAFKEYRSKVMLDRIEEQRGKVIAKCANCEKDIIYGVPSHLSFEDEKRVYYCIPCAEELGMIPKGIKR